jgi:ribosomal protein S12 methylthiotransferase
VGQEIQVIVDQVNQDQVIARSKGDSPEIDGNVFLPKGGLRVGDIINAQVKSADSYDLWAECEL